MTDLEQKALGLVNAQFREPWYKTWEDIPQGIFARAILYAAKSIEKRKIAMRTLLTDSQRTTEALEAEVERLREALELADASLRGANMNMNVVERKVRAALKEIEGD